MPQSHVTIFRDLFIFLQWSVQGLYEHTNNNMNKYDLFLRL